MRRQARIVNLRHTLVRLEHRGQRQCIGAGTGHAQRQCFSADSNVMCRFRPERRAEVAQRFRAQLRHALGVRRLLAKVRCDVRIGAPVEQARIGQRAAQRDTMTANRLGQRIDHETSAHALRAEQPWRGHRVVDHVQDAPLTAQLADAGQVRHLRARIGDRLDKHHARVRRQGCFDLRHIGRIDKGDIDALPRHRLPQAVGIAKQEARRDDGVACFEQRLEQRADGRHAGAEAQRGDAIFHLADLVLERADGWIALATITEARLLALEHGRQLTRIRVAERDRRVDRLVQRTVLDRLVPVVVQDRRGKAVGLFLAHAYSAGTAGFRFSWVRTWSSSLAAGL